MEKKLHTNEIAEALFVINKHAKTALQPQHLYHIKKKAIERLLQEKRAQKIGLHFSNNPKLSSQHSILLIQIENFYFHLPPKKEDFKNLKHLGNLNTHYRNPKVQMSLSKAKKIIYNYIHWQSRNKNPETNYKKNNPYYSSYYIPSSLGTPHKPYKKRYRNLH